MGRVEAHTVFLFARLYLIVITVLLLAALVICLPVLVGIVREGLERQRKWRSGELEKYTPDPEFEAGPGAARTEDGEVLPPGRVSCPYCGATNDAAFTFCGRCASPL